jgi:hypothetical protein
MNFFGTTKSYDVTANANAHAANAVHAAPADAVPAAHLPELLPYRAYLKDTFNEKYATKLTEIFNILPNNIKIAFNEFTKDLMKERYISRNKLLDAIADFRKENWQLCDNSSNYWTIFDNAAFNSRPWQ